MTKKLLCLGSTARRYYKYVQDTWTQPTMTSNGVMGGGTMAINYYFSSTRGGAGGNTSDQYKIMRPNSGYIQIAADEGVKWVSFQIYFPEPVAINSFYFFNRCGYEAHDGAYYISLGWGNQAYTNASDANNDANWNILVSDQTINYNSGKTISFSNSTPHQYYRLKFRPGSSSWHDACGIADLAFFGTHTITVPATESDYDFYSDQNTYETPYRNGNLYCDYEELD